MGDTKGIFSICEDIDWWLKTTCTNRQVDPSIDWGKTKTLMYESYQFHDLLHYLSDTQGWTPTFLIEHGYNVEVTFNNHYQELRISNGDLGKPQKVRVSFNTEYGMVALSYYSNTYQLDTHWDIHFDY